MEVFKRFIPIDIVKAIGVFIMILIHVLIMYGSENTIYFNSFSQYVIFIIEGIGAPVFVFAMGASIVLSKEKGTKPILSRGLKLFLLGYILNFFKFFLTIRVFQVFPEALFIETNRTNDFNGLIEFLLIADILQFAGIAYVICSILKKYIEKIPFLGIFLAIVIFVASPYLYQKDPNYLLSLIYGKGFKVYFALFPWLGFVLVGMSVGFYIKIFSLKKRLNNLFYIFFIIGFVLYVLGLFSFNFEFKNYFATDYYHKPTNILLMYCGQILLLFSVMYFIHDYLSKSIISFIIFCSKNVTTLYIFQWVIIYWGWYFVSYQSQTWQTLFICFLIVSLLTFAMTFLKNYLQKLIYERRNFRTVVTSKK